MTSTGEAPEGTGSVGTAMAAILQFLPSSSSPRSPARGARSARAGAAALVLAAAAIGGAQAQNVVAFVNGEPITALDIDQRSKLLEVSSPTHKAPPRAEVLDELINEKLKIREAKRWGIDPSDRTSTPPSPARRSACSMNAEQFIQTADQEQRHRR